MAISYNFKIVLFIVSVISLKESGVVYGYPQKRSTGGFPELLHDLGTSTDDSNTTSTIVHLLGHIASSLKTLTRGMPLTAGDCSDIASQGPYVSGVYTITPWDDRGHSGAFSAFCDMNTEGGGWTVIQKRFDGSTDFFQDWNNYKNGFGDLNKEFWLGLENIHRLTRVGASWTLRIELEDFDNNTAYAQYEDFGVGDESTNFQLMLGAYSGTAGDGLTYHADMPFSTKDRDNDLNPGNCPRGQRGAWWYKSCHQSNLNGFYSGYPQQSAATLAWRYFTGPHEALKRSEMKIRPSAVHREL